MPEFKPLFFKLTAPCTPLFSVPFLRKRAGINLVVPVYHTVCDQVPDHIRYLYPVKDTEAFRRDLDTLLRYYKPATIYELINYAEEGTEPEEPVFHLTFDDGLSEFYSVVAPILREKGVPATCFLNNDFIDNRQLFFRFKESLLVQRLHQEQAGSGTWKTYHDWALKHNLGSKYYRKLILSIDYTDSHLLDELASALGISFDEYLKTQKPYLETNQIQRLIEDGFTFGAHSADHIDYRSVEEAQQLEITRRSINDLVQKFNPGYRVFSFPFTDFGISRSFYKKLKDENIASMTFGCAGIKRDFAPVSQQRIPIELYKESFQTALKKEYLYYIFLKITGKGRMDRK
jgi:peptidoglycan/xylan/chitin deacetylase (PgdA/CDA1 family)